MVRKGLQWGLLVGCLATVLGACCSLPSYKPAYWNDKGTIQYSNNCYNYGNNKRTDTLAQPGRASGTTLTTANLNCTDVRKAAVADGLDLLPPEGKCLFHQDKVALVVDPGVDYHWYRLDSSGMWSHKPGRTAATDRDNSGQLIANPETADRCGDWLCYTEFCGYHCACSDSDEGQGHENIN